MECQKCPFREQLKGKECIIAVLAAEHKKTALIKYDYACPINYLKVV